MEIIKLAELDNEIEACFPIMLQLRPFLKKEEFLQTIRFQCEEGYKLAFVKDQDVVRAVAGFRIYTNLAFGKFLYVDDLITDSSSRSKGYAGKLFDWLIAFAKQDNCQEFHLDSGVQRFDAHRFYLKRRMHILAHHFSLAL